MIRDSVGFPDIKNAKLTITENVKSTCSMSLELLVSFSGKNLWYLRTEHCYVLKHCSVLCRIVQRKVWLVNVEDSVWVKYGSKKFFFLKHIIDVLDSCTKVLVAEISAVIMLNKDLRWQLCYLRASTQKRQVIIVYLMHIMSLLLS